MLGISKMIVRTAALYFLYALVSVNCDNTKLSYYWKEYTGNIPFDVGPGGLDKGANPIYIGQVYLTKYGLLPATIIPGVHGAITSAGGETIVANRTENIKILCSADQSKLKWAVTRIGDKRLFNGGCHVVNGGFEGDQIIHIGRVYYERENFIGKVFSFCEARKGLWVSYYGRQMHFNEYEVLTFDCNVRDQQIEN